MPKIPTAHGRDRVVATERRRRPAGCIRAASSWSPTPDEPPLPFAEDAFDLVVRAGTRPVWWGEIARVLRAGGTYFAPHVGPEFALRAVRVLPRPAGRRGSTPAILIGRVPTRARPVDHRTLQMEATRRRVLRHRRRRLLPPQGHLDRARLTVERYEDRPWTERADPPEQEVRRTLDRVLIESAGVPARCLSGARRGFEPTEVCSPAIAVFKTAALGHYASPPGGRTYRVDGSRRVRVSPRRNVRIGVSIWSHEDRIDTAI